MSEKKCVGVPPPPPPIAATPLDFPSYPSREGYNFPNDIFKIIVVLVISIFLPCDEKYINYSNAILIIIMDFGLTLAIMAPI